MLLVIVLAEVCIRIAKEQAENIAREFVSNRVKFYTKDSSISSGETPLRLDTIYIYEDGNLWVIMFHVTADVDNSSKKNDLVVKVGKDGRVVEFNGKPVLE